jgi:hypothetical protein
MVVLKNNIIYLHSNLIVYCVSDSCHREYLRLGLDAPGVVPVWFGPCVYLPEEVILVRAFPNGSGSAVIDGGLFGRR